MSSEVQAKLEEFTNLMDDVFFEQDLDVELVAPDLIRSYCALRLALANERQSRREMSRLIAAN